MGKAQKPFIAYWSGRWNLKIVPRNAAGWRALIIWTVMVLPPTVLLGTYLTTKPAMPETIAAHIAYILFLGGWSVAMIRWMLARSERVDLDELLAIKHEQDRSNQRRGGRPPASGGES
jgi:hypothetical protein